jgi:putative FmdB family regulatory protein
MPIYEYRCDNGHTFEAMQRMSDDPLTTCEVCGAPVQRVFHPVAIHFKGSGFYNTDYGKRKRGAAAKEDGSGTTTKSDSSSNSDGAKSESKAESKPSSSSTSSSSSD